MLLIFVLDSQVTIVIVMLDAGAQSHQESSLLE